MLSVLALFSLLAYAMAGPPVVPVATSTRSDVDINVNQGTGSVWRNGGWGRLPWGGVPWGGLPWGLGGLNGLGPYGIGGLGLLGVGGTYGSGIYGPYGYDGRSVNIDVDVDQRPGIISRPIVAGKYY